MPSEISCLPNIHFIASIVKYLTNFSSVMDQLPEPALLLHSSERSKESRTPRWNSSLQAPWSHVSVETPLLLKLKTTLAEHELMETEIKPCSSNTSRHRGVLLHFHPLIPRPWILTCKEARWIDSITAWGKKMIFAY